MAKIKHPLFSLDAVKSIGKALTFRRGSQRNIAEPTPQPFDAKTAAQLSWRHLFLKVVALWNALTAEEQLAWESNARPYHLTGYQRFVSQALRPNPGIYLPLQGGNMTGTINMGANDITGLEDPDAPQDADTQAARDAAIAAALADPFDVHLFGKSGATWYELQVESAAQHNLRVKLYDGANGIYSFANYFAIPRTQRGLFTHAVLRGRIGTNFESLYAQQSADDNLNTISYGLETESRLYGFDSSTWDRLRTWLTGILKVGRADIGLSTIPKVGAGAIKASPGNLYWITMNPTAPASVLELSDDLDGSTAYVWRMLHGANAAHHMNFDPPLEFSTGIWLKTWTNMDSAIFGYV